MKNIIVCGLLLCLVQTRLLSQNVGISVSGATPDASAMLDVSATNKGFLMPRMSTVQRTGITSPAPGLAVYDTDTHTFWFHNGTGWIQSSTGSSTNYWSPNGGNIFNSNAGFVGIGLNTPLAPLHVKNDLEALRLQGATPYLSFYDNAGVYKSFMQGYNSDLYLGTPLTNTTGKVEFYLQNVPALTILPSGNVGIGLSNPTNKFMVKSLTNDFGLTHTDGTVTVGSYIGDFEGATGGWFGTKTNHPLNFFTFNGGAQMTIVPNGGIGIDNVDPHNKLEIGAQTAYGGFDLVLGEGVNATGFNQTPTTSNWSSTTNIAIRPASGYVGINTLTPTNKLQIGSVGGTGFATNDLAIGNGVNAMAIQQTDASTLIGSTTDIVIKPRNNGAGNVGINTNTPHYPLEVFNYAVAPSTDYAYYAFQYETFVSSPYTGGIANQVANVSIMASARVMAVEFDAFSDARIKMVIGVSDARQDLEALKALRITDYTMKDRAMYGNRKFKKVIAQEVEKLAPQVVSTHTDFIPNVYQVTSSVVTDHQGSLLQFKNAHHISADAKKIRLMLPGEEGMKEFKVLAVPSESEVLIDATGLPGQQVFVYGEQVSDFRTVDYEGLTTLTISATQELDRLVEAQKTLINQQGQQIAAGKQQLDRQQQQIALLEGRMREMERLITARIPASRNSRVTSDRIR